MAGEKTILTPEETAQYLRKSLSWVYKNAEILGGRKLGGSLFFPAKEDLYERIFYKRQEPVDFQKKRRRRPTDR